MRESISAADCGIVMAGHGPVDSDPTQVQQAAQPSNSQTWPAVSFLIFLQEVIVMPSKKEDMCSFCVHILHINEFISCCYLG